VVWVSSGQVGTSTSSGTAFNGASKPGFYEDLMHKDLGLALDLAARIKHLSDERPLPATV